MKITAYSSVAAFLAHYQVLKSGTSRSADDGQLLAEMAAAIDALGPDARAALESAEDSSSARRHRQRAERQLRRELAARGSVAG